MDGGAARPRTRVSAIAATYGAHGYALAGDRAASDRCYDLAHETAEGRDDDPDTRYGLFLDHAHIRAQRAQSLVVLGDYRPAVDAFEEAVSTLPPSYYRDRGVYLAREAVAHAGARDPDRTSAVGLKALAIGTETGSDRIMNELHHLDTTLSHLQPAATTDFQEAMAELRA